MKKPLLSLFCLVLATAAHASSDEHLKTGEWSMTAAITSPTHLTIHYTACNKGQDWSAWMVQQQPGQSCVTRNSSLNKLDVACTESLPNGMKISTSIQGDIQPSNDGRRYHGIIHGSNTMPGGMTTGFEETLDGVYSGACKNQP